MFGICTKKVDLDSEDGNMMLGDDEHGWGLSNTGCIWHAGRHRPYTKSFRKIPTFIIGIYFGGLAGTLTYYKDGVSLGIAFTGLQNVTEQLYPIVGSGGAKTSLGFLRRDFQNLQDRCRASILSQLTCEEEIEQLELPTTVKHFISEGLDYSQEEYFEEYDEEDEDDINKCFFVVIYGNKFNNSIM